MDDLISKLSEIRSNYNCLDEAEEPYYRALSEAIKRLSERVDGDTISRKDAIELAMQYCPDDDGTCSKADEDIRNLLDELEDLPSAQPQQVTGKLNSDCISRQEAIKELEELNAISFYELNEHSREAYREIKQMLKELPPAQTKTEERTEKSAQYVPNDDLISRKAAIDAVCAVCGNDCDKSEFVYNAPQDEQVILCPEHFVLCTLPPAQTEQSVAQERYEDLCEYFGNDHDVIKTVLGDRKEFKAWLERLKWHVKECNKLSRQLEAQPEQKWIPCSKRLPDPYEYCLWTTIDGRVVYHHCDGLFSKYIAWMPLPEPWKEEQP